MGGERGFLRLLAWIQALPVQLSIHIREHVVELSVFAECSPFGVDYHAFLFRGTLYDLLAFFDVGGIGSRA